MSETGKVPVEQGQALEILQGEVQHLRSLLAARDENLKVEGAGWKDITDALAAERDELKESQRIDADYIKWLCERLDEANAAMRKYRDECWRIQREHNSEKAAMLGRQSREAPTSAASITPPRPPIKGGPYDAEVPRGEG